MEVLVTYFSQTGNTKKVADAIFTEIDENKALKELSAVSSTDEYDLIFVGFPMQAFGPAQQAKDFLERYCHGKKIALFITHGVKEDFRDLPSWIENCKQAATEAVVMGVFDCQGEVADFLLEAAHQSADPIMKDLAVAGTSGKGQPDSERLRRAGKFAKVMISKSIID